MAKAKQKSVASIKTKRSRQEQSHLHFAMTAKNYMIMGVGIVIIIIGYILMDANSVDGFMPTVVAPVLLVLGYCVIVPAGILFNDKATPSAEAGTVVTEKTETKIAAETVSSNVKTG